MMLQYVHIAQQSNTELEPMAQNKQWFTCDLLTVGWEICLWLPVWTIFPPIFYLLKRKYQQMFRPGLHCILYIYKYDILNELESILSIFRMGIILTAFFKCLLWCYFGAILVQNDPSWDCQSKSTQHNNKSNASSHCKSSHVTNCYYICQIKLLFFKMYLFIHLYCYCCVGLLGEHSTILFFYISDNTLIHRSVLAYHALSSHLMHM